MGSKLPLAIRRIPPVPDHGVLLVLVLNRPVQLFYRLNLFLLYPLHLDLRDAKSQIAISSRLQLHSEPHHLPEALFRQSQAKQPLERCMLLKEQNRLLLHPTFLSSLLRRRPWRISGIRRNVV